MQILAEHRRLLHHALGPEDAAVSLPALAIPCEPRRNCAAAPMQRMLHGLLGRIDIGVGRHLVHEQDAVEPARHQQPRERPRPGEPSLALVFVEARMLEPGRRVPPNRLPLVLAVANVHRAIDQHGEARAGAGAELEQADAPLDAVLQLHQPHAGKLRQRTGMLFQFAARVLPAIELHGLTPLALRTAAASPPPAAPTSPGPPRTHRRSGPAPSPAPGRVPPAICCRRARCTPPDAPTASAAPPPPAAPSALGRTP